MYIVDVDVAVAVSIAIVTMEVLGQIPSRKSKLTEFDLHPLLDDDARGTCYECR